MIAPGGMVEMDHKIAVVRNDGVIESQSSDATPIPKGAPLKGWRAPR